MYEKRLKALGLPKLPKNFLEATYMADPSLCKCTCGKEVIPWVDKTVKVFRFSDEMLFECKECLEKCLAEVETIEKENAERLALASGIKKEIDDATTMLKYFNVLRGPIVAPLVRRIHIDFIDESPILHKYDMSKLGTLTYFIEKNPQGGEDS